MKHVDVYTDGACSGNPGPGGYAAIVVFGKSELELSGFEPMTTNNRMELTAPIKAMEALKEKCDVTVYSDSVYLTDAFNKGWIYNWELKNWKNGRSEVKNPDLFKRLLELTRIHNVTWVHVKGHADNEYNNRCDKLAVAEYKAHMAPDNDDAEAGDGNESEIDAMRDVPYEGELGELVLDFDRIYSGKVFNIEKRKVQLPNGYISDREIVVHIGGAAVVAVNNKGELYMVRQFRSAAGKVLLEIPAGKLEKGEDPAVTAARELHEETGLSVSSSDIRYLSEFYATPGYCTEKIYLYYYVSDGTEGNPHRDRGELLKCETVPFNEMLELARSGKIEDAKTALGIMLAASVPEIRALTERPETV